MHGYAVLFLSGLGIGALGTLIGAGGGWMIVPLLLFGYHFSPQEAVGTSLAVVFLNALSGSVAYMVQGRVLYRMGLAFAIATIPGALLGASLVQYLDSRWFSMLFGVFLLLIAAFLHRGRQLPVVRQRDAHVSSESLQAFRSPYMRLGIVISFLVGVSSSLFGIGGGIIHVLFLRQGHVRLPVAASMGLGVLLGAQLGALLSMRLPSEPIRRTLAIALAIFACWLILQTAL